MLQFCLSLVKQSKPSILTAAGFWPNFIRAHPPLRADADGDEDKVGTLAYGLKFPEPKCSSWTTGFETRLGGDPQKNGGDEAIWFPDLSTPLPLERMISRSSAPALKSLISEWLLGCQRGGLILSPSLRGLGQTRVSLLLSHAAMAFCSIAQKRFILFFLSPRIYTINRLGNHRVPSAEGGTKLKCREREEREREGEIVFSINVGHTLGWYRGHMVNEHRLV